LTRHNFSKATIRAAKERAGGRCEASGTVYGLEPETRCGASLEAGSEVDHYPMAATDDGSDTLENAVVCCKSCHRFKTSHYDVPMQAKGRRIRIKNGMQESRRTRPRPKMRSKGFDTTKTRGFDGRVKARKK
jgi:hypothetical protein